LPRIFHHCCIEPGKLALLLCFAAFVITFLTTRGITRTIYAGRGPFHDNISASGNHVHHAVPGIVLLVCGAFVAVGSSSGTAIAAIAAVAVGIGTSLVLGERADDRSGRRSAAREPQPSQRCDRLHGLGIGLVGHRLGRRGPINQPQLALGPPPCQPLSRGPDTDPGRLSSITNIPTSRLETIDQQPTTFQTEPGVSVQLHPVSPWDWGLDNHQPPRRPG
jgi:hypothetical protein